jgi:anti-sigma factor ChrR (cupin superfamily)
VGTSTTGSEAVIVNGDRARRAVMDTRAMDWTPSPSRSVSRKRVHRVGGAESGQVTSVVRYEPGASFPVHDHPEGEEILVLEGVFSDEHGDWPVGTHLLNPEGFRHAPFSREGCTLFVKLRQYAGPGRDYRKTDTRAARWQPTHVDGVEEKLLYDEPGFPDRTRLERWAEGTAPEAAALPGGVEIFVIEGVLEDAEGRYEEGTWLRLPDRAKLAADSPDGCLLYVKSGAVSSLADV